MNFLSRLFGRKEQAQNSELPKPAMRFPFEVLEVPGAEALSTLEKLRRQGQMDGFTAVLLGGVKDVTFISDVQAEHAIAPEEVLKQAKTVDVQAWFSERVAQEPEYYEVEIGDWPGEPPTAESITAHLEMPYLSRPKKSVFIAKVPTMNSWEIPAYLGLGGWNECPFPKHLVAVSKYWHDVYGADIAAVTGDTIEYLVENPPADKEAAEKLAREHFIYCTDIVYQGTQTLRNLAAGLVNGKVWFFWWD
jgi:hypothetical protein